MDILGSHFDLFSPYSHYFLMFACCFPPLLAFCVVPNIKAVSNRRAAMRPKRKR